MIKYVVQLIVLVSFIGSAQGQFEGKIVYQFTYESNSPELPAEALAQFMGTTHEYYVNKSRYASVTNGIAQTQTVYFPSDYKLVTFYPNGDSVVVIDVRKAEGTLKDASLTEDTQRILSWDCKSMTMNSIDVNLGEVKQTYYYAEELEIDNRLYQDHKYGNWDSYTKLTGSFPLKYVMEFPQFSITGTAISVEEMDIPDSFFDEIIPKDKLDKN